MMRGVILAGGKGTRMGELGLVTPKCLLPLGDVPMIYHSIRKMVDIGIKDIMIISNTGDFMDVLGSGNKLGCNICYRCQDEPLGIPHAIYLAKNFCCDSFVVILGDNIFEDRLVFEDKPVAQLVLKQVEDPKRYGVAEFVNNKLVSIIEKPENPPSNLAVTGIYCYPMDVFSVIERLKPSKRGEYEITDVNNFYIQQGRIEYSQLSGYWIDAGTIQAYHQANRDVFGEI